MPGRIRARDRTARVASGRALPGRPIRLRRDDRRFGAHHRRLVPPHRRGRSRQGARQRGAAGDLPRRRAGGADAPPRPDARGGADPHVPPRVCRPDRRRAGIPRDDLAPRDPQARGEEARDRVVEAQDHGRGSPSSSSRSLTSSTPSSGPRTRSVTSRIRFRSCTPWSGWAPHRRTLRTSETRPLMSKRHAQRGSTRSP